MTKGRKIKITLLTKITSILCCVALVAVGFAIWWIVNYPSEVPVNDGSFAAYTTGTRNVTIGTPTFETPEIKFGAPTADDLSALQDALQGKTPWLTYDTEKIPTENLSSILKFSVQVDGEGDTLAKFIDHIYVEFNAGTEYEDLIGTRVANPVVKYHVSTTENATVNWESASTATYNKDNDVPLKIDITDASMNSQIVYVQVKFDFDWEYKPTGVTTAIHDNPYIYCNNQDFNPTLANDMINDAKTGILDQVAGLNDKTYTVKIYTDPKASN